MESNLALVVNQARTDESARECSRRDFREHMWSEIHLISWDFADLCSTNIVWMNGRATAGIQQNAHRVELHSSQMSDDVINRRDGTWGG
jgi:hypothetical protein